MNRFLFGSGLLLQIAARLPLLDLVVGVFDLAFERGFGDPVADRDGQADGGLQVFDRLALVDASFDGLVQLHHELLLAGDELAAAGHSVAGQHELHFQLFGGAQHGGPVADVGVHGGVVGPVDHGVAGAEDLFFRQIGEAVAAGVGPSKVEEFNFALAVVEDELRLGDVLLGRLGRVAMEFGHIGAALDGGQPARRFQAFHFGGYTGEGDGGRPGLGPDRVAVNVVAVVVRVEDILDGLGREAFAIGHGAARAAGIVGFDDHQIIFHLDDRVIAVALFHAAPPLDT